MIWLRQQLTVSLGEKKETKKDIVWKTTLLITFNCWRTAVREEKEPLLDLLLLEINQRSGVTNTFPAFWLFSYNNTPPSVLLRLLQ